MKKITFDKFETAQKICETIFDYTTPEMLCGMSIRINGGDYADLRKYSDASSLFQHFDFADRMIKEGRIFYTHVFKCKCGHYRFQYGSAWACNECGNHISTPQWWNIKIQKDGNQYCVVGDGFLNLQESDNYAFGETKDIVLENYRQLFVNRTN